MVLLENTIFYKNEWRWSDYLKSLIIKLEDYKCLEYKIPAEFMFKEASYGSTKNKKNVQLVTLAHSNDRISYSRSVCIDSPDYSVLNFLIIPKPFYNIPFFGVDFVSLPKYYLIVLDFQPSITLEKQFHYDLLDKLIEIKNYYFKDYQFEKNISSKFSKFFSPGLIMLKLPKDRKSDELIKNNLYSTFEDYLNLYFQILFKANKAPSKLKNQIKDGQSFYLDYRHKNDPARPMLKNLFGEEFTESLIDTVLFKAN